MKLTDLRSILQYIPQFREKTFILAIDGDIVTDDNFATLMLDVALLWSLNIRVVLVHGAAAQIRSLAEDRQVKPSDLNGAGVTDAATLDLALTAANRLTHEILEGLSANDLRAAYANAIVAHPVGILQGVDHLFTGKVERVDAELLQSLLGQGVVPVIPPLGFDGDGKTYRVNSDGVALAVAEQLKATKLIFVTTQDGLIHRGKLIPQMAVAELGRLVQHDSAGFAPEMISKAQHATAACTAGIPRVHVINGTLDEGLLGEVFSNHGLGTLIYANEYEHVRPAKKKDVRAIQLLTKQAVEADELLKRSKVTIEKSLGDYFIFEIDKNPVACVAFHVYPEENQGEVACLYVAASHENQGIGRKLIQFVEDKARELNLRELLALSTQAFTYFQSKGGFVEGTPGDLPPARREKYERTAFQGAGEKARVNSGAHAVGMAPEELTRMLTFSGRVLFVGFGAVARCTLPILLRHINVDPRRITIMEFDPDDAALKPWLAQGLTFVRNRVTQDNLGALLSEHLSAGDLLIDLAWNIDCGEIVQWCHDRGVLYINTSVELWDPYAGADNKHPTERTLYWRHMKLRRMVASWTEPGPTAVIEHGANPGLISHFTKQALLDIAARALDEQKFTGAQGEKIAHHGQAREFNHLARELGVKVIHCSERDTQVTNRPKEVNEFLNTWSVEGFREEGTTTTEMGWGTHEKELPALAFEHPDGPGSQICLARMGINTFVASWVPPDHHIVGMVVRHGEAFTITEKLTVWKDGQAVYRPTVHYAYCPCDSAVASLYELRGRDYDLQPRIRIMTDDEIVSGADMLGALVMGHPFQSWWCGSDLDIDESRRLVPHQNATTMQVAISVVAACMWMMENPRRGVCVPDDLPHDYVLEISKPYLGTFLSVASDWNPLKHYSNVFHGFNRPQLDPSDPWQFKNFLITEGD